MRGGPSWSPVGGDAARSSTSQRLRRTTAGDHEGPPFPAPPPSPLRRKEAPFLQNLPVSVFEVALWIHQQYLLRVIQPLQVIQLIQTSSSTRHIPAPGCLAAGLLSRLTTASYHPGHDLHRCAHHSTLHKAALERSPAHMENS